METIDVLRKEFSEIISLVGYGGFLVGLKTTISKPTFVKELSTEKLKAYIILAELNVNDVNQENSSIRDFLEDLDPELYRIHAAGMVYDIYKALKSHRDELIDELVERSAL